MIRVHAAKIECTFAHPRAACTIVQHGEVDLVSGRWGWQFAASGEQDVEVFKRALIAVLGQDKEAALPPLAKAVRKLEVQLRASGRIIKVTKEGAFTELIATSHQEQRQR